MSNFISKPDNSQIKHLCAIIRKPQEGKTFICLQNINKNPNYYHIIITMNTIKSNLQFFERAKQRFGDKICVFNSREKKKDQNPNFLHSKDVIGVKKHLNNGSKVVIMCAHPKRFDVSILDLLVEINSDIRLKKQVIIHIDEAHAYVPIYRSQIVKMNDNTSTNRIYMYSATPFSIWTSERSNDDDKLFKDIFVVDCEKDFGAKKSELYFGVKDCEIKIIPKKYTMIDSEISSDFIMIYGNDEQRKYIKEGGKIFWYGTNSISAPFSLGDEVELISYTKYTLSLLRDNDKIKDNEFSYNFVPGFCRKLTHYAIMENILDIFPTSLVIIINGDGSRLFRMESDNIPISQHLPQINEPSEQIEDCIKKYPNRPVFITGFHCVGMSVTFINKHIGNFDNVIFSHEHYTGNPDILYQLCRFLFNYINWDESSIKNIKNTILYVSSQTIIDHCLEYEKQIDKITEEMTDSLRTKCEVQGDVKVKEKKIPKECEYDGLIPFSKVIIKKITIDDVDEEDNGLKKLKNIYKEWMGKELSGKALPNKNERGFYECSTTGKKSVIEDPKILKNNLESWKPTSNYDIKKGKYRYARVYVAYEDKDNSSEYTWFIRKMEINRCEAVDSFWVSKKL